MQPVTPENNEDAGVVHQSHSVEVKASEWRGPLPSPEALAHYESTHAGAADRILRMAEVAQANEHDENLRGLNLLGSSQRYAFIVRLFGALMWIVMVVSGLGFAASGDIRSGFSILGTTLAVWAIVTLVRIFKGNGRSENGSE